MTNEDMAFKFANKNADKYINDEDPLGALRDGFLCGCQKKDQQFRDYLEKKRKEILNDFHHYPIHRIELIDEIINKLWEGEKA